MGDKGVEVEEQQDEPSEKVGGGALAGVCWVLIVLWLVTWILLLPVRGLIYALDVSNPSLLGLLAFVSILVLLFRPYAADASLTNETNVVRQIDIDLLSAVKRADIEAIEKLLADGADPYAQVSGGFSAIRYADGSSSEEIRGLLRASTAQH